VVQWGRRFVNAVLPMIGQHVEATGFFVSENMAHMAAEERAWRSYLQERHILVRRQVRLVHVRRAERFAQDDSSTAAVFPEAYGPAERDVFYNSLNSSNWGGGHGTDVRGARLCELKC
jgi:hypothetical protein